VSVCCNISPALAQIVLFRIELHWLWVLADVLALCSHRCAWSVQMQIAALGGMAVIVAQPTYGLSEITTASAETFAKIIEGYEEQGASMLIEFGHEMNGNWYAWGQQPAEYIKAFQTMSTAIAKVCEAHQ